MNLNQSNLSSLFDWKASHSWFLLILNFSVKKPIIYSLFLQMPFFMGPLPVSYLVSYSWWALPVLIGCNHGKIHRVPSRTWVSGNFAFTNFDILIINLITFFMDVTLYMVSKEGFGGVSKVKTIEVPSIVPTYDGTTVQLNFDNLNSAGLLSLNHNLLNMYSEVQ